MESYLHAGTLARLSARQILDVLYALDERIRERRIKNYGKDDETLQNLEAARMAASRGALGSVDVRVSQKRAIEQLYGKAIHSRGYVWRGAREGIEDRLERSFETLVHGHAAFIRLRRAQHDAADSILREAGMQPLAGFWMQRLKFALFAPPKPLDERIRLRALDGDDDGFLKPELLLFPSGVKNALGTMPHFMRAFLDETGYDIRLGERMSSIDLVYACDVAGVAGENRAYDTTSIGTHSDHTLEIDIPLYVRSARGGKSGMRLAHADSDELRMTLAHEFFHGVEQQMGFWSVNDKEVITAFNDDLANLRARGMEEGDKRLLEYFLPVQDGGVQLSIRGARTETVMELAAEAAMRAGASGITPYFHATARLAGKLAAALQTVYAACPQGLDVPDEAALVRCTRSLSPLASIAANPLYRP